MSRYIPKNPQSKLFAKELRKKMTKEERHLWYDFLCTYRPSFRRQFVIGHFIVDFYCPAVRLAVELDGSQHYEDRMMERDSRRTGYMEAYGIKVVRYTNLDILQRFDSVCLDIDEKVKERLKREI